MIYGWAFHTMYFSSHVYKFCCLWSYGSIRTIDDEGDMISIIEDGRFVLPGTEALNEPFGE